MATIIDRFHKAVEATVIVVGQLVTQFLRSLLQPIHIALTDLLNLRVRQLYRLSILLLLVLRITLGVYLRQDTAILVALILHKLRHGIV